MISTSLLGHKRHSERHVDVFFLAYPIVLTSLPKGQYTVLAFDMGQEVEPSSTVSCLSFGIAIKF